MQPNNSVLKETSDFISNHPVLCCCTFGLAIAGYCIGNLAGRGITNIAQCCGSQKKAAEVSQQVLHQVQSQPAPPQAQVQMKEMFARAGVPSQAAATPRIGSLSIVTALPTSRPIAAPPYSVAITVPPYPQIPPPSKTDLLWEQLAKRDRAMGDDVAPVENLFSFDLDADFVTLPGCPKFVASAAPSVVDLFWTTIFNDKYTLFDLTESHGSYYPTEINQEETHGDMVVKLLAIKGIHHTYQVTNKVNGEKKEITGYHFKKWPDFGVVDIPTLDFLVDLMEKEQHNHVWVHCVAGRGRTGTLVTAYMLKSRINQKVINLQNLDDSLLNIISQLRKQRGGFVETRRQFALLHDYAKFLLKKEDSDRKSSQ